MSYKDLLDNIKEDSQTETLHLNSRVLLVDSMNMFLRSFAVIGSTNTQGTHIGGMIGFLRSLAYTVNLVQPTRIICVFDGQGNTTNRSSPVQVGALTNWLNVAASQYYTAAVKTDGTLWTWGYGSNLGLGNTTYYSSPKQVGALTTWSRVYARWQATFAISS